MQRLFCRCHFPTFFPLSHPRASVARPGNLLDCRDKPGNDIKKNKPEHDTKKSKPKHDTKKNNPIMTERNNPEHDGEAGEHDGGMKRQSMTKKER